MPISEGATCLTDKFATDNAGKAFETLADIQTKREALDIVEELYKEKYGEVYEERLVEQARLVYMIQERDKASPDGLKHWSLEYGRESCKN